LQVSEIPVDGSGGNDFLDTDPQQTTYNYDVVINQDIIQQFDQNIIQDIVQEIPIFYKDGLTYAEADAFYGLNEEGNISQDDYTTDLGGNRTIIEVLADGYVTIQKDYVQNFNQDIVQDVYYEIDIVQDFIQTQTINQDIIVDVINTETATRLVSE
jgi:hypothetical protein